MNELVNTLHGILTPHLAAGQALEGLTILQHDMEGLKDNCLVIRREREDMISQARKLKTVTGNVALVAMMQINQRSASATVWRTAEQAAETWARKVEKIIMANPALALLPDYEDGFTRSYEDTHFISKEYGTMEEQGAWWVFCKATLQVKYIYRDGSIARN